MKYFLLLITSVFLTSIPSWAAEDFNLIPSSSHETSETKPMGAVNDQGEIEWKYPPGYFDKKKQELVQDMEEKKEKELAKEKARMKAAIEAKNKEIEAIKKRAVASQGPSFIPGKNKGRVIKGTVHLLGYYYGANLGALWQEDQWAFGFQFKGAVMSNPDTNTSITAFGAMGLAQYHFFPRWYTNSPKTKTLDPYTFVGAGVAAPSNNLGSAGLGLTTGLGASYPLSSTVKAFGEYEIFLLKEFKDLSGSYSMGLTWEF